MSNKNKLIALSKEIGFKSKIILFDSPDTLSDTKYYLWMCEFKLWMIEVNGLDCFASAGGHLKHWIAYVDHDTILDFKTVYVKDEESYESLPQALEMALYQGAKLLKK